MQNKQILILWENVCYIINKNCFCQYILGEGTHFAVSHRGNIFVLFENFRKPSYGRKADGITDFFNGEFGAAKQFFGFFDANLR